jgi:glycosyltransferase involved in cell wall biosynthesis
MTNPLIVWNGTSLGQERNEGYKSAEDNILAQLHDMNIYKTCLSQFAYVEADILINNRLPIDYQLSSGYNIGFSYWETTRLPSSWVDSMNQMDEIWTTSSWAKNVFEDSGVTVPVFNFKLGVDSELFKPVLKQKPHYPFTFLCIGAPSTRKNSQMVVDAFIKLFGKDDRYRLIYKSVDAPDARIINDRGELTSIYNYPNIVVIDQDVTLTKLSSIYDLADCLAYPTSGEGWGMLPYQALAKAIPTICTDETACIEYAHLSIPLRYKLGIKSMSGIYGDCGNWAEPNFDDLCDKMLYVVNNYEEVASLTYSNVEKVYHEMTWEYVAKDYKDRLCQILKKLETKH